MSRHKKATIHQVTTKLATSKNVLFPGHNQHANHGADNPTLLSPKHQCWWLAGGYDLENLWTDSRTSSSAPEQLQNKMLPYSNPVLTKDVLRFKSLERDAHCWWQANFSFHPAVTDIFRWINGEFSLAQTASVSAEFCLTNFLISAVLNLVPWNSLVTRQFIPKHERSTGGEMNILGAKFLTVRWRPVHAYPVWHSSP